MTITHLLLTTALAAASASAQKIASEWHGAIEVENDAPLRLALHISRTSSGALSATLDSMDEGGTALPVDTIVVADSRVTFEMRSIGGAFSGKLAADGTSIAGSWSQDGAIWPLTWLKGEDPGNTWRLFDRQQALQYGRTYTQWFYEGRISDLWQKLSPVMHQALGSEAKFGGFREQVLGKIGLESKVNEETVTPEGILQVYRRRAKFDRVDYAIDLTVAFDPNGVVARFEIRP